MKISTITNTIRLLLDVVVRVRAPVFELLSRGDQALLVRADALLVLNLGLDVIGGVLILVPVLLLVLILILILILILALLLVLVLFDSFWML